MNARPLAERRGGWGFLLFLGLLAAGSIALGVLYLDRQQAAARSDAQAELEAIADLKVQQIVNWRRERLADVELIRATPYYARRALDALAQPGEARTRQMFTGWLDPLFAIGPYERALLLDDKLNVRLVHPEGASRTLSEAARGLAEQALLTRQVAVSDLHRSEQDDQVYLNFVVPLVVRREGAKENVPAAGLGSSPADRSAGVLLLKLNVNDFLFPLIQTWPTHSPTAETLLVRREGQEVLFLNELRHRKGTALKLRRPLNEARLPAAMGLRGENITEEGVDYRGVLVVAAARPVPDTPWVLVAKVDTAEIYAPLRREALKMAGGALLTVLTATFGITLLWRRRGERFLSAQLAAEREQRVLAERADEVLRESEAHYRSLFDNMLNGFACCRMLFEQERPSDFIYLSVNRAFETLTGLKEVTGRSVSEVLPGLRESDPGLLELYGRVARTGVPETTEIYVRALQMWFAISVYRSAPDHFVAIFDGITARKQAEEALRQQAAELGARNDELERFNRAMSGRELRVIELKQQVDELAVQLGRPRPYPLAFLDAAAAEIVRTRPRAWGASASQPEPE
jgi:PAS domain S-box-containing protein